MINWSRSEEELYLTCKNESFKEVICTLYEMSKSTSPEKNLPTQMSHNEKVF